MLKTAAHILLCFCRLFASLKYSIGHLGIGLNSHKTRSQSLKNCHHISLPGDSCHLAIRSEIYEVLPNTLLYSGKAFILAVVSSVHTGCLRNKWKEMENIRLSGYVCLIYLLQVRQKNLHHPYVIPDEALAPSSLLFYNILYRAILAVTVRSVCSSCDGSVSLASLCQNCQQYFAA